MSYDSKTYRDYAREHDVKRSTTYRECLWNLAGGKGRCPWSTTEYAYDHCRCAAIDHTSVWKSGRVLKRITTEPYGLYKMDDELERAVSIGVEVRVLPRDQSMWCPGSTILIEFIAPKIPDHDRLEQVRARVKDEREKAAAERFDQMYGEMFVDQIPAGWSAP